MVNVAEARIHSTGGVCVLTQVHATLSSDVLDVFVGFASLLVLGPSGQLPPILRFPSGRGLAWAMLKEELTFASCSLADYIGCYQ